MNSNRKSLKTISFSDKIIMHHKIFFNVLALPTQSKQTVFKQDNLNNWYFKVYSDKKWNSHVQLLRTDYWFFFIDCRYINNGNSKNRGNPSTYTENISQYNPFNNKTTHQHWINNSIYLSYMQNFGIWAHFQNKIANDFNGPSIIH